MLKNVQSLKINKTKRKLKFIPRNKEKLIIEEMNSRAGKHSITKALFPLNLIYRFSTIPNKTHKEPYPSQKSRREGDTQQIRGVVRINLEVQGLSSCWQLYPDCRGQHRAQ